MKRDGGTKERRTHEEDTIEALLEPLLRLVTLDAVGVSNARGAVLAAGDTSSCSAHDDLYSVGEQDVSKVFRVAKV